MSKDHKEVFICDMGISNLKEITKPLRQMVPRVQFLIWLQNYSLAVASRGPAVDVYAFGCLVNEVFGGRRGLRDNAEGLWYI